jgi:hypothetical protein
LQGIAGNADGRCQSAAADDEGGEEDFGPMPKTAVILLSSLAIAWILIILYVISEAVRKNKTSINNNTH